MPAGCGKGTAGEWKVHQVKDGDGKIRDFAVSVSQHYNPNQKAPIIFAFRGTDFTNEINQQGDAGIAVIPVEAETFWPDGSSSGVGWQWWPGVGHDIVFFDNMVNYLEQNFCADTSRVFVNGYSWGGDMGTALFCLRGDKIKGISDMDGGADMQDGSAGFLFAENNCTQKHPSMWYRFAYNGWYTKEQKDYMANFFKRSLAVSDADSDPIPFGSCRQYRNTSGPLIICNEPNMGHVGLTPEELTYIWRFWKSLP